MVKSRALYKLINILKRASYRFFRICRRVLLLLSPPGKMDSDTFCAIIFSKDRPLQLQALLQSMHFHVSGLDGQVVLYHSSAARYETAYQNLRLKFPTVTFVHETSFRGDLLSLLKRVSTQWIFFLVDDIIFTDAIDLRTLPTRVPAEAIVSLRLHPRVTYSYMMRTPQEPPDFVSITNDMLQFNWRLTGIDWAYPLSVDGHIFDTKEIRFLIGMCNFKAPNSLEASLQIFRKCVATTKIGICFQTPKLINFPVNRVQTEFENAAGDADVEKLLQFYSTGAEVNFLAYKKSIYDSLHVETELQLKSP